MNLRQAMQAGMAKAIGPAWEVLLRLDEQADLRLTFFGGLQAQWVVRLRGEFAGQKVDVTLGTMLVTRVSSLLEEVRNQSLQIARARVAASMSRMPPTKFVGMAAVEAQGWAVTKGRGWARIALKAGDLLGTDEGWPEVDW